MSVTTEEERFVAAALRAAFEFDVNPGNTVQGVANPLQLDLRGSFDLLKAAQRAIAAVREFDAYRRGQEQKAAAEARVAEVAAATPV